MFTIYKTVVLLSVLYQKYITQLTILNEIAA
jgi:hypothetical protein